MEILGLIPARYGSTRFPGKPLADIMGKPMIWRVYEQAGKYLKHIWVATDDERIKEAIEGLGGNVVMTNADHMSGTDRCAEALSRVEEESGIHFDVVINIQGDEPFVDHIHLNSLAACFENPDNQIATLVKPFGVREDIFNENKPKVVLNNNKEALYFSRHPIPFLRDAPRSEWVRKHTYFKHLGLYAYRSDILKEITKIPQSLLEKAESLEQNRWLENGYRIQVAITESESISVDTPGDLARAVKYYKKENN